MFLIKFVEEDDYDEYLTTYRLHYCCFL